VQSGSDVILSAMRRGYTRAQYLDTVGLLRDRRPDLALSSDIIVGHPGETEDDFAATVSLVDEVGFDALFVFMYSPRPGTTALRLGDPVPDEEKRRRFHVINDQQQRAQRARNAVRAGSVEQVLVDTVAGEFRLAGRTPHFRVVHFEGPPTLVGSLVEVEVTDAGPNSLVGRLKTPALTTNWAVPTF
jgi:tRNA-2-methylthio-N6-dimethylallyladenosine synthase